MNDQYIQLIEQYLSQGLSDEAIVENLGNDISDEAAKFAAEYLLKKKDPQEQGGVQDSSSDPSSQGFPGSATREIPLPEGETASDFLTELDADFRPETAESLDLLEEEADAVKAEQDELAKEQGAFVQEKINNSTPGRDRREVIFELLQLGEEQPSEEAMLNLFSLTDAMGLSSVKELSTVLDEMLSESFYIEASQVNSEQELDRLFDLYDIPADQRENVREAFSFDRGVQKISQAFTENPSMSFDDLYSLYEEVGFDDADIALLRETYPSLDVYTQYSASADLARAEQMAGDAQYNARQVRRNIRALEAELQVAGVFKRGRINKQIQDQKTELERLMSIEEGYEMAYNRYRDHADVEVPKFREDLINDKLESLNPAARAVYQNAVQESQLFTQSLIAGNVEDFVTRIDDNYRFIDRPSTFRHIEKVASEFDLAFEFLNQTYPDEFSREDVADIADQYMNGELPTAHNAIIRLMTEVRSLDKNDPAALEAMGEIQVLLKSFGAPTMKELEVYGCVALAVSGNDKISSYVAKATAEDVWYKFSNQSDISSEDLDDYTEKQNAFIGYHIERALREVDVVFGDLDDDGEIAPSAWALTGYVGRPYLKDATTSVTDAFYGETFTTDAETAIARVSFSTDPTSVLRGLNQEDLDRFVDYYEDRGAKDFGQSVIKSTAQLGVGIVTTAASLAELGLQARFGGPNAPSMAAGRLADASRDLHQEIEKNYQAAISEFTDPDAWGETYRGLAQSLPVTLSLLASGGATGLTAKAIQGATYAGMAGQTDASFREFDWYNDLNSWEKMAFVNLHTAPEFATEKASALVMGGAARLGGAFRAGSGLRGLLSASERQAFGNAYKYYLARTGNYGLALSTEVGGEALTAELQGRLVNASWTSGEGGAVDIPWTHIMRQSALLQGAINTGGAVYNTVNTNVNIGRMRRELGDMLSPQKIREIQEMPQKQRIQVLRDLATKHEILTAKTVDAANMYQWAFENSQDLFNNMTASQQSVSDLMDQLLDPSLSPASRSKIEGQVARELVKIQEQETIALRDYHKMIIDSNLTDRAALRVRAMKNERGSLEQELAEVSEAYRNGKASQEKLDFVKSNLQSLNEQIAELQPLADEYASAKARLDQAGTLESKNEARARLSATQAQLEGTINKADRKAFIEGVAAQARHTMTEDIAAAVDRGDILYIEQGNTTMLVRNGEIVDVIKHDIGFKVKTQPGIPRIAAVSGETASTLKDQGYSEIGSADGKTYMVRDQFGVLEEMDQGFIESYVGQDTSLSDQAKKVSELVVITEMTNTVSSKKLKIEAMADVIGIDGGVDPTALPGPLKEIYDKNKGRIDAELENRRVKAEQRSDEAPPFDRLYGSAPPNANMSTEDGRLRLEEETSRWSETLESKGIKVQVVPEAWLFANMKDGKGAERWRSGVEIGGKFDGDTIYIADTARAEDVTEEFLHAAVTADLLSNQHTRNKAKISLEKALAEDPALSAIVYRKVSSYGDLTENMSPSQAESFLLNESLTEVMKVYIDMADTQPSSGRFAKLTNSIREMLGMTTTVDLSDGDVLSIAERIVDASNRGEVPRIKMGVINLDQEKEERGDVYAMKNWLGGKPVTIEIFRHNSSFSDSRTVFSTTKTFKDYLHFKNFINSTTGNGKLLDGGYVTFRMTYQDGNQTKDLYMPKPRVDREGNLVEMEMNKIGQNAMPWWRKEMIKQDKARQARAELPNKIDAAVDMADFLGLDREALQSMVKQWAGEAAVSVGFRLDGSSFISFSKGYNALAAKNVLSNLEKYIEDTGGYEAYALWQATQEGGSAAEILANVDQNLQELGYAPGRATNTAVARMWPTIARGLGLGGFSVKGQPFITGARVAPTAEFLATGLRYTYENSEQGESFKNFFKEYSSDENKQAFAERFAEETSNNESQFDSQKQMMLDNWGLFSTIVAITSNGSQATRNLDAAVSIFDLYMRSGDRFVEELDSFINVKGVKRTPINGQRLKEVQKALNTLFMTHKNLDGDDAQLVEHLLEPVDRFEENIPGRGMHGFDVIRAQKLFGGKIGAFGGNLLGREDLIAMDQHFTHETLRATGWYPESPKYNRLIKQANKAGYRNADGSEITNLSELVAVSNKLVRDKRGSGGRDTVTKTYGEGSVQEKLYDFASEYAKLLPSGPGALPQTKEHIVFFHAIAEEVMNELNKTAKAGEEWTMAAVQQLMFLDNKLVQEAFGVSSAETATFSDVMQNGDINFGGVFGVTGKVGSDARVSIVQNMIDAQEGSILQGVQSLEFNKQDVPVRTSEEIFPDGYKKPKDGKGDSLFKNPTQKQTLSFTSRDGQSNVTIGTRDYALVSASNVSFEGGVVSGFVTENLNTTKAVTEKNVEGHEIVRGEDGNYYVSSQASGVRVSAAENVVLANGKIFATGIKVSDDLDLDITASELAALEEAFPTAFDVDVYAMRRTAARGVSMYADLFDQVNQNPDFFIKPESLNDYKEAMGHLNDSEILTYLNNEALTRLSGEETSYAPLAQIELFNRYTAQGDQDAALLVLRDLSKMGTNVGRMLRQFAELKSSTPEGVKNMILGVGMNNKAKLTDAHKEKADALSEEYFGLYNKYLELRKRMGDGEDVETELKDVEKKVKAAEMDINRFVNQISERSWFEMARVTAQGNLLTLGSQATNVFANLANVVPTGIVDLAARPLTGLLETTFPDFYGGSAGAKRAVSFGAYLDGLRGFGAGVKEAFGEIRTGQSADVTEWRQARGFMPIHSLTLAFSSNQLPEYETRMAEANARLKHFFQGTLGIPAETMFRFLSLGDTPFRRMVERKELSEIGRARGLEGPELQRFIKYPPADVMEQAKSAGLKLTFQEDTSASAVAESTIGAVARSMGKPFQKFEGFDGEDFFNTLIRLNVPYVRTPANILEETLTYASPGVALARTAKHLAEGDARGASENLAKGVVGQAVTMTTMYLIANGLISGPPEEDKKKRGMQYSSIPPNCINVTALQRVLEGGSPDLQDGDVMMNYQKLGLFGSIMGSYVSATDRNAAAAIIEDDESMFQMNDGLSELFGVSNISTIGYMMDQSFLQGLNTSLAVLSAGGDPDDIAQAWSRWAEGMFKTASAIVLPNQLSALNRAQREYMPDFRSADMLERMTNVVKDRTFMTNELPIRYNWKGQPIKQTPGDGGIGYQLIGFSKMHAAEIDDVTRAGVDLYSATGEVPSFFAPPQFAQSVYRKQKPPSVSRGKAKKAYERLPKKYNFLENPEEDFTITLNANQINHAIKLACQPRYNALDKLVHSEEFKNMSDSERADAFDKVHQGFNGLLEYDENGDFMPHSLYILDLFEDAYNEQYETDED